MAPIIRPARAEELQTAQQLVVRSINDLSERHGFNKIASPRPADFQLFSLKDDPDGLWVAETDGEIVGFVFSWATGDFWFLAQLFVSPTSQGDGIGGALLARAFEHARNSGARNRALITFAFNVVSTGLYIKYGLLPRLPIYVVRADKAALKQPSTRGKLRAADIADTPAHREFLARLDRGSLGFSRDKHHAFLRGNSAVRGVLLLREEVCVGYAYVSAAGHIGPLAVNERDDMGDAFATALDIAMAGDAPQVSAFVPGVSKAALDIAAANGMRLAIPTVLMSVEPFGDWQRYLPSNPGFM
jgi:ribosomal protein S18 acetylase RimI-like enzyme